MPIKYIPYTPDPIQGQALLNNISRSRRLLRYRDNDKVFEKIQRGMPYYEVELVEQVGEVARDWNNLLLRGECLAACACLEEQGIRVDLVYIDPPFASGANYARQVYIRRMAEKIAHAEQELDLEELQTFEETMYGDIWRKEDYLDWMYENLVAIKTVMADTASIYVHLDWQIGHYVKILMDEIFGEDNFINEIVWCYKSPSQSKRYFKRKHDVLFVYCKEDNYIFNADAVRVPYDDGTIKRRQYGETTAGGIGFSGMEKGAIETGRIPEDWWDDIPSGGQISRNELKGYPTQKPEALLERIIKASSDEGMIVADFFGGSGVTAKVAHDLNRKFIHCDVGINSLQITRERLKEVDATFQVMDVKDGVSLFRNPKQTMDKLAKLLPGLQQQVEGLGDFWFGAIQDSRQGSIPVYVPDLNNSSDKVLDIPVINRIINEELQKLEEMPEKAIVYFVDIDERKKLEQFIRDNNPTVTEIELRDLKTLLDHTVSNDEVQLSITKEGNEFVTRITGFHSDRLQQKITGYNAKRQLNSTSKSKADPILLSDRGLELIEWLALDCNNNSGAWHSSSEVKIDKSGHVVIDGRKTGEFWDGAIVSRQRPLRIKIRNIAGDETLKTLSGHL